MVLILDGVTQNMLRTNEGKLIFPEKKNVTESIAKIWIFTCENISELPSNLSTLNSETN